MERRGVQPDLMTYNTAMDAMGKAGEHEKALRLFAELEKHGERASQRYGGTRVADHGSAGARHSRFRLVVVHGNAGLQPNLVSYNTAIHACGRAGSAGRALELLEEMKQQGGVQPDTVSQAASLHTAIGSETIHRAGARH